MHDATFLYNPGYNRNRFRYTATFFTLLFFRLILVCLQFSSRKCNLQLVALLFFWIFEWWCTQCVIYAYVCTRNMWRILDPELVEFAAEKKNLKIQDAIHWLDWPQPATRCAQTLLTKSKNLFSVFNLFWPKARESIHSFYEWVSQTHAVCIHTLSNWNLNISHDIIKQFWNYYRVEF